MFNTSFLPIRDYISEIEMTFNEDNPTINLAAVKGVIMGFGANDPALVSALCEPFADPYGYTDTRDYILGAVLGTLEGHLTGATNEGYSYKRFVKSDGEVTYRFFSNDGRGDNEAADVLDAMRCVLGIAGGYEATGATGFSYR